MKSREHSPDNQSSDVDKSVADSVIESDSGNASDASHEWQLLDDSLDAEFDSMARHDIQTAPLMMREAYRTLMANSDHETQYGVLGKILSMHHKGNTEIPTDTRLYVNTNAPFSAIVCGVQGAGKSHTVATMLESMLINNFPSIGTLKKPLCGLVLHYGEGGPSSHPSEAAWLSSSISSHIEAPPVRVYVSHSSLQTMRSVYAPLGQKVKVEPLYFHESELDAEAFISMMAVGSSDNAPLYMQVILSILRDLGEKYSYKRFENELESRKRNFNPAQLAGVEQRMSLLTSFLTPKRGQAQTASRFAQGQLTIVDLSDPFLDAASASGLFEIILRLFVRAEVNTGKVLLVDEAHKYLSSTRASSGLTKSLLTLIRQQRHLGIRVIISTQEPTVVPPVLLDLCTMSILHRFSSPSWWTHLTQHVSADFSEFDVFDQVVRLQNGQAIVLCPDALGIFRDTTSENSIKEVVTKFGRRYMMIRTRQRVTADGGASVLVLK